MSDHSGTARTATLAADELTPGVPVLLGVLRSLVGPSMVLFVRADETGSVAAARQSDDPEVPELALEALEKRVKAWLADSSKPFGYEAVTVAPGWQLLMAEADDEISIIRKFAVLCGSSVGNGDTEPPAPSQWRLDDLVTRVAVGLMPVTGLLQFRGRHRGRRHRRGRQRCDPRPYYRAVDNVVELHGDPDLAGRRVERH
jgi:hypothetical protein